MMSHPLPPNSVTPGSITRRSFAKTMVVSAAYTSLLNSLARPARAVSPSRRLNIACVGAGGKGWDDMIGVSSEGALHNIVALCDIDHRDGGEQPDNLAQVQLARPLGIGAAARKFPKAALYSDFRRMLERKDIDAITVSTPDHMHATIALSAMALGKHVFVQKPLTQTVHEARVMREMSEAKGVTTQMGNQYHSSAGYRSAVKAIQEGIIGKVKEAYSWTSSPPVWPLDIETRAKADTPPKEIHWDSWIGVAQPRPYKRHVYHNFNWRAWKEFGAGTLGDLGCHVMDSVVWSLALDHPRAITAEVSGGSAEVYPNSSVVTYEFPATKFTTDGFKLTWCDGRPPPINPALVPTGMNLAKSASLFIGEKGTMVVNPGAAPRLYPEAQFRDYSLNILKQSFAAFAAEKLDHYLAWSNAIVDGKQSNSPFSYAGHLTEIVMLGTIAQRLPGRRLVWDSKKLSFNDPAATALVRRNYRKGWEINSLIA